MLCRYRCSAAFSSSSSFTSSISSAVTKLRIDIESVTLHPSPPSPPFKLAVLPAVAVLKSLALVVSVEWYALLALPDTMELSALLVPLLNSRRLGGWRLCRALQVPAPAPAPAPVPAARLSEIVLEEAPTVVLSVAKLLPIPALYNWVSSLVLSDCVRCWCSNGASRECCGSSCCRTKKHNREASKCKGCRG